MTRKTDLKIDGARIVARVAAPAAMALVALMLAAAPVTRGAAGIQAPQAKADTSIDPLKTDSSSPDSVNAAGDSSVDAGGQSVADGSKDSTGGSAGTDGSGSSNDTAASHDSSTSHDTAGSSHDGGNGGSDGGSDH